MQQVLKALSLIYWQICIHTCVHIYICVCVCMCVCVYIYIFNASFLKNNLGTTLEASSVLFNNFSTQIQGIYLGYTMVGKIMGFKTYLGLHPSSTTYKLYDPGYVT